MFLSPSNSSLTPQSWFLTATFTLLTGQNGKTYRKRTTECSKWGPHPCLNLVSILIIRSQRILFLTDQKRSSLRSRDVWASTFSDAKWIEVCVLIFCAWFHRHPNIVSYKEAFMEDRTSTLCIVMEYADGGDLLQKITMARSGKASKLSEQTVWSYFI